MQAAAWVGAEHDGTLIIRFPVGRVNDQIAWVERKQRRHPITGGDCQFRRTVENLIAFDSRTKNCLLNPGLDPILDWVMVTRRTNAPLEFVPFHRQQATNL